MGTTKVVQNDNYAGPRRKSWAVFYDALCSGFNPDSSEWEQEGPHRPIKDSPCFSIEKQVCLKSKSQFHLNI
jgi:hypothetical protein